MSSRTWRVLVLACVLIGLAVRIASVVARPHLAPNGDPLEYWGQANLLVEGKGWIEPITYHATGVRAQTADLPPLFTMLQAVWSLIGFKSFYSHRIFCALLSAVGVPMAAVLGRDVVDRRVGVFAALGVALYPNLWMSAGLAMSETISPIMVMVVLWAAYRAWRSPTRRRMVVLGLAIGFAALARDEMLVFAGFIVLPLAIGPRGRRWGERARLFVVGAVATVAVITPWVAFNLVRFDHPVFITDRFGVTLAAANCDTSWYGTLAGYWSMQCADQSVVGVKGDESANDPVATRKGLDFIGRHAGDLPTVELERLGRTFGFFRVSQQISLDVHVEGRPDTWAWTGLWCFYGLAALAPFGVFALRRRGVPLYPLAAVLGDVLVVVLITYGQTRFRATLEPVLVLLGAAALDTGVRGGWLSSARSAPSSSRAPSDPTSAGTPSGAPMTASAP